jgi:amino acid transporter
MMAPLQSLIGHSLSMGTIQIVGLAIIAVQMFISIYGIRLAASINKFAVVAEILALIVFGGLLLFVVAAKGQINTSYLTTIPSTPVPYWPAFLISILLGAWTIFGFEAPSDLSEETLNVKRIVPKSIISGIITSIVLGAFFIGVVTIAIPNLATVTASADPISTIFASHLGQGLTNVMLLMVLIAMFATALLNLTVATRVLFAISRDEKFVGHSLLKKVSSHGIPVYSVIAIIAVEVITFLTMYGLSAFYASAIVLLGLAYLITVVNFVLNIKKSSRVISEHFLSPDIVGKIWSGVTKTSLLFEVVIRSNFLYGFCTLIGLAFTQLPL